MRRFPFKLLLAAGLPCLGAALLPGCADNDSMMYIIGVAARKNGACEVKPEAGSTLWASGVMDRVFANEYTAALLIGNQLTERGSREQLRTETSRVSLKGAEVKLETPKGAALVPAFSSTATGFVDASSGTDPALGVMFATLIPASIAGTLDAGTVVAKVRVFGETLGGQEVESSELLFPIEVCDGCLISYPASARDPAADTSDIYECKVSTGTDSGNEDLPCQLGIDVPAPCTVCSGIYQLCQTPLCNPAYTDPIDPDRCGP